MDTASFHASTKLTVGDGDVLDSSAAGAWHHSRTLYLIKQLEMIVRAHMEPIVRSCGLTLPRYTAMTIIESASEISSADLARRTFVSAQAANELVNGLVELGLVSRRPSPDHGKIVLLRLTDYGAETLERCAPRVRQLEESTLRQFPPEAAERFRSTLRASIGALKADATPRDVHAGAEAGQSLCARTAGFR